jgi:predicted nucleotidyltransferase component of viral defense system
MKLCESPDFRDAISAAANHFTSQGLTEQFIEKDYYITEALRIIATLYPEQIIFKGGTSLSKGWNLINRFSEDIDLFFNPQVSASRLSQKAIDIALKGIRDRVGEHSNLEIDNNYGRSERGVSRSSYYTYNQLFSGNLPNRILLEMGIRSGNYPLESLSLSSFLAQFLRDTNETLRAKDESSFPMLLLHFKRTFVEKLFAIHNHIGDYQRHGTPFAKYARHYYDLFQLAQRDEVKQLLASEDFVEIKQDCDRLSQQYFQSSHFPPENLIFANSAAIFPTGNLRKDIKEAYTEQCKSLCYGVYPSWDEVEECFGIIRMQYSL